MTRGKTKKYVDNGRDSCYPDIIMADPRLWEILAGMSPDEVAKKAGVRVASPGFYEMDVLNRVYTVDPAARQVIRKNRE